MISIRSFHFKNTKIWIFFYFFRLVMIKQKKKRKEKKRQSRVCYTPNDTLTYFPFCNQPTFKSEKGEKKKKINYPKTKQKTQFISLFSFYQQNNISFNVLMFFFFLNTLALTHKTNDERKKHSRQLHYCYHCRKK